MMQTSVPSEHQALGRKAKGFDRGKWDQSESASFAMLRVVGVGLMLVVDKSRIVEEGNWHKFNKGKDGERLARLLLDTGDRELVEVSPC